MFQDILKNTFFIFTGLMGIGFLIGFHELGHFLFCKLFKISTPSFSIGMGPKIIKKKIGETTFSLSAIPLGGYVEIAGMAEVGQGDQKEAGRRDQFSFSAKPYYQKLLVLSGGIIFNLIFAYFAFIILFMTGIPKTPILFPEEAAPIIGSIVPGSAAEKYHLHLKDKILEVNDVKVPTIMAFAKEMQKYPNQQIKLLVERDNKEMALEVTPDEKTESGKKIAFLGIGYEMKPLKELAPMSLMESIKNGVQGTNQVVILTFSAFKSMFKQRSFESVGGPLIVISETIKGIQKGFKIFLIMLALISVNLAILNLIPLPIMDGGQILFTTIEAIIRKQLPEKMKLIIHYICWIGILLLAVYLSIADIKRIFWDKGFFKILKK